MMHRSLTGTFNLALSDRKNPYQVWEFPFPAGVVILNNAHMDRSRTVIFERPLNPETDFGDVTTTTLAHPAVKEHGGYYPLLSLGDEIAVETQAFGSPVAIATVEHIEQVDTQFTRHFRVTAHMQYLASDPNIQILWATHFLPKVLFNKALLDKRTNQENLVIFRYLMALGQGESISLTHNRPVSNNGYRVHFPKMNLARTVKRCGQYLTRLTHIAALHEDLPHGSGIDADWVFEVRSNGTLRCSNSYHRHGESGYDGWMPFSFILTNLGTGDYKMIENKYGNTVFCRDRDGDREYLEEVIRTAIYDHNKSRR